jgi:hypothetical protein
MTSSSTMMTKMVERAMTFEPPTHVLALADTARAGISAALGHGCEEEVRVKG